MRTRQTVYEVATNQYLAATFMSVPTSDHGSTMAIDHSLTRMDAEILQDDTTTRWLGGLRATLPASIAYLYPTINAYRRYQQTQFNADVICPSRSNNTELTHRLGSSDLNPYLGIGIVLAGGIVSIGNDLNPADSAGATPALPESLDAAINNLEHSNELAAVLDEDTITHWIEAQRLSIVLND